MSTMKRLLAAGSVFCAAVATAGVFPDGYARREFIESVDGAVIDLGFKPTKNTRIEVGYQMLSTGKLIMLMGANDGTKYYIAQNYTGTGNRYTAGNDQLDDKTDLGVLDKDWHELVFNDAGHRVILDGTVVTTLPFKNFPADGLNCTVALFAMKQLDQPYTYSLSGRISHCEVYEGDELVHQFVPCLNPSGVPGLYDLSTRVFLANDSGMGELVVNDDTLLSSNADGTFDAKFSPAAYERELYFSLSDSTQENGALVKAADIPAGETSIQGLIPPAGYGKKAGTLRVAFSVADILAREGYTEVEYVASTQDGCESVDTGIVPGVSTYVSLEFYLPNRSQQKSSAVLVGCTSEGDQNRFYPVALAGSTQPDKMRVDLGHQEVAFDWTDARHAIVFNDLSRRVWLDDRQIATLDPYGMDVFSREQNFVSPGVSMYLFNYRNSGTTYDGMKYAAWARIYSCVVKENGVTVADLVPCVNAQGVAGFFNVAAKESSFLTGTSVVPGKGALDHGSAVLSDDRLRHCSNPVFAVRPLAVVKFSRDRTVATVRMTGDSRPRRLFVVWGEKNLGSAFEAWGENHADLGYVPAGVSQVDVTLPAEAVAVCGAHGGIRVYLGDEVSRFAVAYTGLAVMIF